MKKKHPLDDLKIQSFVTADARVGGAAKETRDFLVCTTTFGHSVQNTVCVCPETSPIECS